MEAVRRFAVMANRPALLAIVDPPDEQEALGLLTLGINAILSRSSLTPRRLIIAVQATLEGHCTLPSHLLERAVRGRGEPLVRDPLSAREKAVLVRLAAGGTTREIASELSYCERTVKNVIHDILVRTNSRTRAQAVAQALRAGII
jgi:DNA-binding NarL/FixJ family response regulator